MPPSLTSAQLDFIGVLLGEKNDLISRFLLVFILQEITLPVYCTTALSYHLKGGCSVQEHVTSVLSSSPECNEEALKVARPTEHQESV